MLLLLHAVFCGSVKGNHAAVPFITWMIASGPPNGSVLFCWLSSVVCRRRLSLSVTLPADGSWAVGRLTLHGGPVRLRPLLYRPTMETGCVWWCRAVHGAVRTRPVWTWAVYLWERLDRCDMPPASVWSSMCCSRLLRQRHVCLSTRLERSTLLAR